jgi:hypothetical protein
MRTLDFAVKSYLAVMAIGYVMLCYALVGLALR